MIFSSAIRYCRRLASADSKAWQHLPYQIRMACLGVDLKGESIEDCGLSEERSYGHRDSGGPDLDRLLKTLPICTADSVIDIGCGKGGAMLTLARYPFARVDGVELSPALTQIARQNLKRLQVSQARVYCCDAADFTDLDLYTYFYMYNPVPEIVLRGVMTNIQASLGQRSRKLTLIYKNPLFNDLVLSSGFRKISETRRTHPSHPPFAVYTWEPIGMEPVLETYASGRR